MLMTQGRYSSYLDEYNKITILVPKSYYGGEIAPFKLMNTNTLEVLELKVEEKLDFGNELKYILSIQGFFKKAFLFILYNIKTSTKYIVLTRTDFRGIIK